MQHHTYHMFFSYAHTENSRALSSKHTLSALKGEESRESKSIVLLWFWVLGFHQG